MSDWDESHCRRQVTPLNEITLTEEGRGGEWGIIMGHMTLWLAQGVTAWPTGGPD